MRFDGVGDEIIGVPWLKTRDGIELSEFAFVIDKANIDFFGAGYLLGLITSGLRDRVALFIPVT
jgi:hypothetical protein